MSTASFTSDSLTVRGGTKRTTLAPAGTRRRPFDMHAFTTSLGGRTGGK